MRLVVRAAGAGCPRGARRGPARHRASAWSATTGRCGATGTPPTAALTRSCRSPWSMTASRRSSPGTARASPSSATSCTSTSTSPTRTCPPGRGWPSVSPAPAVRELEVTEAPHTGCAKFVGALRRRGDGASSTAAPAAPCGCAASMPGSSSPAGCARVTRCTSAAPDRRPTASSIRLTQRGPAAYSAPSAPRGRRAIGARRSMVGAGQRAGRVLGRDSRAGTGTPRRLPRMPWALAARRRRRARRRPARQRGRRARHRGDQPLRARRRRRRPSRRPSGSTCATSRPTGATPTTSTTPSPCPCRPAPRRCGRAATGPRCRWTCAAPRTRRPTSRASPSRTCATGARAAST